MASGGGKFAANGIVWNDGERVAKAGDVVGFAGGEKGDGVFSEVFGEVEGGVVRGGGFV